MKLTVFFDPPYWVGLLEVECDGRLYAARHVFGAEPQDEAVYTFVLRDLAALQIGMTAGLPLDPAYGPKQVSPKRRQREIRRELERQGVTHKAYEAVRLQLEQNKQGRRQENRAEREAERARRREKMREKAKARRKGR